MINKKLNFLIVGMFLLVVMLSFVSAKPPVTTEFIGDTNLVVEANVFEYYKINEGAMVYIHVFNKTNGKMLDDTTVDCDVELTNSNGTVMMNGVPTFDDEHWVMSRPSTLITDRGKYALIIHCNATNTDGYKTFFFEANGYGEELDTAHSIKFNSAMLFMLILFLMALVGLFVTENYIGKLALYWVSHVLFVVGTFSMWQFNLGYTTTFLGMAGAWKVMFYVGIGAVIPMVILSMAWIFYIHLFNEHFEKLISKGHDTESAFAMANKKSKGWFGGKSSGR